MEKKFETLLKIKYGSLDPKVNLEPDFFTGFDPARRKEIVTEEAAFYHGITQPYSKDDKLEKHYESFTAEDEWLTNNHIDEGSIIEEGELKK